MYNVAPYIPRAYSHGKENLRICPCLNQVRVYFSILMLFQQFIMCTSLNVRFFSPSSIHRTVDQWQESLTLQIYKGGFFLFGKQTNAGNNTPPLKILSLSYIDLP